MIEETIKCKECDKDKPRNAFKNVGKPGMCKVCIAKRKEERKLMLNPPTKRRSTSSHRHTIYLSDFHQVALDVLALSTTKSQVVEGAIMSLYEDAPAHVKTFIQLKVKESKGVKSETKQQLEQQDMEVE